MFSYLFSRNPLNSLAVVYMPLSPVSKASKLNITDQPILPQVLSKCLYCLLMTRNDRRIVIIRSKAFPISSSIPLTGFSTFFVQPFRYVHMLFLSRNITDESQYQMLPLAFPSCELIFFLDGLPVINTLLRFQFCPGNVHIQKRNVFRNFIIPCISRISHKRIPESRLAFLIFFYCLLSAKPEHFHSCCQYNCQNHGQTQYCSFFNHPVLHYTCHTSPSGFKDPASGYLYPSQFVIFYPEQMLIARTTLLFTVTE